jgi:hypothetical protein
MSRAAVRLFIELSALRKPDLYGSVWTIWLFPTAFGSAMRVWLLPIAPIGVLLYFAIFPQHLYALFLWAGQHMR